jgi:hypothetical protein
VAGIWDCGNERDRWRAGGTRNDRDRWPARVSAVTIGTGGGHLGLQ